MLQNNSSQEVDSVDKRKEIYLSSRVKNIESSPSQDVIEKCFEIHWKTTYTGDHEVSHEDEGHVFWNILDVLAEIMIHEPLNKVKQSGNRIGGHFSSSDGVDDS